MTKEDIVETLFVNIARFRDDILAIDEIVPDKELMITALLGLPPSCGAFAAGLNSWKVAPTFEELWTNYSQEELRISMIENPRVSSAYVSQHKGNRLRGPRKRADMSKIE